MRAHRTPPWWLAGVLLAWMLIVGCNLLDPNPIPDPQSLPPPLDPITVAFGEQVFVQNCQRCHGLLGAGGAVHPDPIIGCDSVIVIGRNGRGAMPAFPQLTAEALAGVQLYLDSLATRLGNLCPG